MSSIGCYRDADTMTKLPNAHRAEVAKTKVVDYLLSIWHPRGRAKARFFLGFGFDLDEWVEFAMLWFNTPQLARSRAP